MTEDNPNSFFKEVLTCFKMDSFKAQSSIDMLLVVEKHWYNFLIKTKEFGILKNINEIDFFVSTTSKSGIALKGDINKTEKERLELFEKLYLIFYNLNMSRQELVLKKFFEKNYKYRNKLNLEL